MTEIIDGKKWPIRFPIQWGAKDDAPLHLRQAQLCEDCQRLTLIDTHCGFCQSKAVVTLASILDREKA